MSKLADAIRRTQRVEVAQFGFGAQREDKKPPTMLVGVLAPAAKAASAKDADVFIIDGRAGSVATTDVTSARAAVGDAALGAWAGGVTREQLGELKTAGLDFLVFDADSTPAAALLVEDIGFVLALPADPPELFLRSLDPLNLDAIVLAGLPSPLTVAGQIELTRTGGLGRKPLTSILEAGTSSSDVECLRAAGVVILLLTAADGVEALKKTVADLPARRRQREERPMVALPRSQAEQEHDDDGDDDE